MIINIPILQWKKQCLSHLQKVTRLTSGGARFKPGQSCSVGCMASRLQFKRGFLLSPFGTFTIIRALLRPTHSSEGPVTPSLHFLAQRRNSPRREGHRGQRAAELAGGREGRRESLCKTTCQWGVLPLPRPCETCELLPPASLQQRRSAESRWDDETGSSAPCTPPPCAPAHCRCSHCCTDSNCRHVSTQALTGWVVGCGGGGGQQGSAPSPSCFWCLGKSQKEMTRDAV